MLLLCLDEFILKATWGWVSSVESVLFIDQEITFRAMPHYRIKCVCVCVCTVISIPFIHMGVFQALYLFKNFFLNISLILVCV